MKAKDMAILKQPKKFSHVNKARHNKMLTDRAELVFSELAFLLEYLPLSYKFKIYHSNNFKKFFETIVDLKSVNLSNLDAKTKDRVINFAVQLLIYSMTVLKTTMPGEFKIPLKDSAKPFINLLRAIYDYGRKNSLKDIPPINIPNLLSTKEPA